MSVKQFEKWEDVPEEIRANKCSCQRCRELIRQTANDILRWVAEQKPKPAGEPKLTDHWDDIPLRLREKVNRLMEANRFAEAQGMLFAEGIVEGWRQAMEQGEKIPLGWNPKLKKEWIDSLTGNIIGHDEHPARMKFEDLAGLIEEHVDKLGVPMLNLTVSPKVVEKEIDWEQRRWELVKAAMTELIASETMSSTVPALAEYSVTLADAVVAALKK